jgi:hypothetical protein
MKDAWAALSGATGVGFAVRPDADWAGVQRGALMFWGKGSSHFPVGHTMHGWFWVIAGRVWTTRKRFSKIPN